MHNSINNITVQQWWAPNT